MTRAGAASGMAHAVYTVKRKGRTGDVSWRKGDGVLDRG